MRARSCNLAAYPPAAAGSPCAALSLGVGREFAAEAELAARHGCAAWVVDPLVRRRPEPAAGRLNFLRLPFVTGARGFHDGRGLVRRAGGAFQAHSTALLRHTRDGTCFTLNCLSSLARSFKPASHSRS